VTVAFKLSNVARHFFRISAVRPARLAFLLIKRDEQYTSSTVAIDEGARVERQLAEVHGRR
jgi:hypothetical protein